MSPEVAAVLQDAIKIMGGALVGGWFAYRAGKLQLEAKLKELQGQNEFKAREHLFSYFKERADQALKSSFQLGEMIGKLAAELEAEDEEEAREVREARLRFYGTIISTLSTQIPTEIPNTQSQLESVGLGSSSYHRRLGEYLNRAQWNTVIDSREAVLERALLLFEIFSLLAAVGHLVLTQRAEKIFSTQLFA